ncbi:MAG: DUF642 domain-containing protein, partial [Actinobacteria bacterium]|nr:DUF642 domain-containing protein [Actinomycetota bacterium]
VIGQTCATRPQQTYSLSFAYSPRPKAPDVTFEVWYAGSLLETIAVPAGSPGGWSHRRYTVTGVSGRDELEFRALDEDPTGVWIDDCFLIPYDPLTTRQLLRNGNFEEDPRIDPGVTLENPVFVGWSSVPHKDNPIHDLGSLGGYDGPNALHLNDKNTVAQQVYVVPGQPYQLTFAYSPDPADDRDRLFDVSFGGTSVATLFILRSATIAWSVRTVTVTSPNPLASLRFTDRSNGAHGTLIDAVSLVGPAPEPETAGQVAAHWIATRTTEAGIVLNPDAMFARGIAALGDLDLDGVQDLAIGSVGDDDGATNAGAVWIAFMNANRTFRSSQKISETRGGLVADLKKDDGFGRALACIGDLDADGIVDLAVGANEDDTGAFNAGAVYVL